MRIHIVLVISAAILIALSSNTYALETLIQNKASYITQKTKPVANGSQMRPPLATGECLGSSGIDARGQFVGFSFFRSTKIKQCDCRENAKIYEWLGEHEKAIATMDACQPKKRRRCFIFFKCKEN